jgi:hypothetical protein
MSGKDDATLFTNDGEKLLFHANFDHRHGWREWATSEKFLKPLFRKLSDLIRGD